ncbi:hypothetical protein [Emticicia fluvialis]|uniref:hypothetical protein n=1 Tax=Emticicia fluvialis TaxID=2974474 RepID=UPI0021657F30|nr:hypothetical protein [Emticicia fluvialis]
MFNQEVIAQIKKFKRGATYNEVKAELKEAYTDTDTVLIVTQAFKEYNRGKANRFILYAIAVVIFTGLYVLFYEQLKPIRWIMVGVISVVALAQGIYLKYKYRKKK